MKTDQIKIIFTNHALQRCNESGMTESEAVRHFCEAGKERLDKHMSSYKRQKYNGNAGVSHYRNGPVIYTAKKIITKREEFAYLIITVCDQRITGRVPV